MSDGGCIAWSTEARTNFEENQMAVEGRGIQSIEVGGRILNALIELGRPTMLRDLASKADMTAAQAHSYLVSYRKMGLVEQETTSGRYLLGPMALQLGLVRMRALDPLRIASDVASRLSEETGFMVTVTVWGLTVRPLCRSMKQLTPSM